jgi:SWI/SNF-related matrix-associated actin-dependent regulator of chromatin subfamily A3
MIPGHGDQLFCLEHDRIATIQDPVTQELLLALRDELGVEVQLQIHLTNAFESFQRSSRRSKKKHAIPMLLANLYGSMDVFDDVGDFLQDNNQYLQDPQGCDRNVLYRNPHMMAGLDDISQWTSDFDSPVDESEMLEEARGLMDGLQTDEILAERETPPLLKTPLHA